jgi:hypothetical protein
MQVYQMDPSAGFEEFTGNAEPRPMPTGQAEYLGRGPAPQSEAYAQRLLFTSLSGRATGPSPSYLISFGRILRF